MSTFWQGKRVAVLGGAGFLGSHVVDRLLEVGATVLVIDDMSRGHNIVDGAKYDMFDLAANRDLYFSLLDFRADTVLNLAASVAGVLYNQTHNAEMFANNLARQSVPVEVCEELRTPRFIQVSSVCVYAPEYAAGAIEENGQLGEPVQANNGYAWAKRMGERVALWADLPSVSIVRPSNMYGPRDYFDDKAHVIPALIKKCLTDDVIEVHGTGDEVREFLYVEDAAAKLLEVAMSGQNREIYNIGTNGQTQISIGGLVKMIQGLTSTESKPIEFTGGNAGDVARWSKCGKAYLLNHLWTNADLTSGLRQTIEWYQSARVTA